jgi:hypothetical protein
MENENDYADLVGDYRGYGISNVKVEPDFNLFPDEKKIKIPETFKDVLLKLCPEISDVVSVGYRENTVYDPTTFNPIYKYLVGVDIYFDNHNGMKKSKYEYSKEIDDYFKMTYGNEMEFVSFHVQSFIFPPEKSNKDKFFELFSKVK